MDTISEKDTQSADDKKKEKISYIEAIPEWQALRREYRSQLLAHCVGYFLITDLSGMKFPVLRGQGFNLPITGSIGN